MNKYFDHTLLKADATKETVGQLLAEAKEYNFMSVCVNPTWVAYASEVLKDSDVKVCTVIGFPLGATPSEVKAFEADFAEKQGANEVDMVINVGRLKSGELDAVKADIKAVVDAVSQEIIVKVIIETALLTNEEKQIVSKLAKEAGADFVKTSTGFSTGGATVSDVALMREAVGPNMGVKASGGIKNKDDVTKMITVGATRIGTSSGIEIMKNSDNTNSSGY